MVPLGRQPVSRGFLELHAPDTDFSGHDDRDRIRVLHVDDDPAVSDLVVQFLDREDARFDVATETDATVALETLASESVDCIVSDYQMPGMDGLEFLAAVRQHDPDLPFVLFTGKGSEEIASDAIEAGVTGYLQKKGCREQYALLANRIEQAVAHYRAEQNAERSLRALEHAGEGIAFLDDEGTFIYVNEVFADLHGYDRQTLIGESFDVLTVSGSKSEPLLTLLNRTTPDRWRGPAIHQRADGSPLPVEVTLTYSPPDRSYVCTVHGQSDTEALQAELSLKEMAMDAAPIGIVITDSGTNDDPVIYANGGFCRLTGYDEAEILGLNCRFLQGDDTDTGAVAQLRAAIDARAVTTVDLLNYRKDGTPFWNRVNLAPIRVDGRVTHFVGFQQDITELKGEPGLE
ncbi:PAS domain-containing protein [Haloarchaeobius sp. DT45]|uniref:PAS domain-containing protein n=1 Tax=Haloarchaeobius sp. DT45 TaxID=3446116 RepID=UPI003F6D0CA4